MNTKAKRKNFTLLFAVSVLALSLGLSGCAPLLVAGGAVGGYAIAKNVDEGSSAQTKK